MASGGQPVYSSKLGLSKSPRFECLGLSCWSLGGPVVLTHTQWGSLDPGLYNFLGTPIQSLCTPPLGKKERGFFKGINLQAWDEPFLYSTSYLNLQLSSPASGFSHTMLTLPSPEGSRAHVPFTVSLPHPCSLSSSSSFTLLSCC